MVVDSVFFQWSYHSVETEPVTVFPDGCRDVLVITQPGTRTFVTLTSFDFRPRPVALPRGTAITGYRLRPGSVVDLPVLDAIAANPAGTSTNATPDQARG